MKKIPLIYILGSNHSGSTLLSLMLNAQYDIFAGGELWALSQIIQENRICSCSKKVMNCLFWNEVLKKYHHHPLFPEKRFSDKQKIGILLSNRFLDLTQTSTEYANEESIFRIFQAIFEITEEKIIIDESKNLERLIKLLSSGKYDIKIIHLVRDGRSALDSAKRAHRRGIKSHYNPIQEIIRWNLRLLMQFRFLKIIHAEKKFFATYKKMTIQPEIFMNSICKFLNIRFKETTLNINSDNYFFNKPHHILGGNRVKFFPKTTPIVYNDQWKNAIGFHEKLFFNILFGKTINSLFHVNEL